ncbi:hypothetical protein ACLOJK_025792, partial [Asimina triloba]
DIQWHAHHRPARITESFQSELLRLPVTREPISDSPSASHFWPSKLTPSFPC